VELLRGIPLSNEAGWEKYVRELNPVQRREFISYMSKIVNSLSKVPAMKNILAGEKSDLSEHLIDS
jgi:hypothetical protein